MFTALVHFIFILSKYKHNDKCLGKRLEWHCNVFPYHFSVLKKLCESLARA